MITEAPGGASTASVPVSARADASGTTTGVAIAIPVGGRAADDAPPTSSAATAKAAAPAAPAAQASVFLVHICGLRRTSAEYGGAVTAWGGSGGERRCGSVTLG